MGYHFSHSSKEPKTKKEKLRAAKQYFVTALIFGAVTTALAGWSYMHLNGQVKSSKAQAESAKKNEELFRDLARSQGAKTQPSPVNEPPAAKSGGLGNAAAFIAPVIAGVLTLLMFCMGIFYIVNASQMPEMPENV